MLLIQVKLLEEVFTPAQKKEIISKLTDTMVSIEGEKLRPYTLVLIDEVRSGDWGVGGKALTSAEAHELATAKRSGQRQRRAGPMPAPRILGATACGPPATGNQIQRFRDREQARTRPSGPWLATAVCYCTVSIRVVGCVKLPDVPVTVSL